MTSHSMSTMSFMLSLSVSTIRRRLSNWIFPPFRALLIVPTHKCVTSASSSTVMPCAAIAALIKSERYLCAALSTSFRMCDTVNHICRSVNGYSISNFGHTI